MEFDHLKIIDLASEGNWEEAHHLIEQSSDKLSCLVHAYVHRIENNNADANYWYGRAGVEIPVNTLEEEKKRLYEMVNNQ